MAEKTVTFEEFQAHQQRENLWILLHGKVYDVAKFLDEHPGGEEVIVAEAGKDATESFEDVGHSDEARDLLKGMLVGTFAGSEKLKSAPVPTHTPGSTPKVVNNSGPGTVAFLVPLACLGAYFAYRYYGA
ncbi:SubName: Full=Probable cytochrome b5 {ECO:0000313/EMBL:CCA73418.1} [Serendipita indica DSM 11827]|uniref:Probable cytochrome b5 n=1 Tax=Serendipita indica (strain DSM 11827) TaxID=1109443 RepID=G4TQ19_SERID|nr:SubName: Full=Probable cytochrome b5 {ECO:0000313/EMBL:CCA73418.1} [Serendipita indica DSM 11827]CCA73418.1 probable cytochrome b5 [Serendipita indica DSM 11827]